MKKLLFTILNSIKIMLLLFGSLFLIQSCEQKTNNHVLKKNHAPEISKLIAQADTLYYSNKFDSALYYYNKAQLLCDPDINCQDYVYTLSSMGELQTNNCDYAASEANLTKTLPYLKRLEEPIYARNVYSYIAYNYYVTYDYNTAILYHTKALKLPGPPFKKAIVLTDIAIVYIVQGRYQEAAALLEILASKKIIYKKDKTVTDELYAQILDNLGLCYFKLNKPKALELVNESLKINKRLKNDAPQIHNYRNLALIYDKSDPKLAKEHAIKSYEIACDLNSTSNKITALAQLIEISEGNELKKYSQKYIQLSDSFTDAKQKAKNQFARIKYDSEKDKAENLELKTQKIENELQLERQKNRTIISYIIIICILGLVSFLSFHLTLKGKKEKNDAIYKSEMRISRKLHEELTNNLHDTINFTTINNLELSRNKEELLKKLDNLYSRTRNISKENSTIITTEEYIVALKEMIAGFKTSKVTILLNGLDAISWNEIDKNKKIILYRVLQELFSNMKKHSQATFVSITFKINDKNFTVVYNDNGIGATKNNIILKNGLQNVESRIKTIKGTIIFDPNYEKGFKLSFTFPL